MTREEQITFKAGSIADGCIAHGAPWKDYYQGFIEGAKWADTNPYQPSLPSDLDEAAEKNFETMEVLEHENIFEETHRKIFKAGAEWMAGQVVKAHCVESCNPVSNSEDENLHLITLVYAKNENTPYVLAGDEIEIILRKK